MKETKFKNTEIGKIPEEWKMYSIGKDCSVKARIGWQGRTRSEYLQTGHYGLITSTDLIEGKVNWDTCVFVSEERYKQDTNIIVKNGDVLVSKDGTIGKVAVVSNLQYPTTLNSGVFVIRTKNEKITQEGLGLVFISPYFKDFIKRLTAGSTIVHLYQKDIVNFTFPIPTLPEQHRIASALTSIDNLISSLGKLIEKKKNIKQGTMQQLLTGKTRLKGFNEPWMEHTIDELFDLGNGYTPSKSNPAYWTNGTIPWFRMEDIRTNGRILKDSIQHVTPEAVKGNGLYPKYSIILSTTATIGEHALLIADSLANQQFTFLNRKVNRRDMIDIIFFYHYCFILGKWCRDNINAGGLLAVNMDDLKNHSIYIPKSIAEQQAIATILTKMDDEITALEAKRAKYEAIKQGMMQQLLTGKIRLIS